MVASVIIVLLLLFLLYCEQQSITPNQNRWKKMGKAFIIMLIGLFYSANISLFLTSMFWQRDYKDIIKEQIHGPLEKGRNNDKIWTEDECFHEEVKIQLDNLKKIEKLEDEKYPLKNLDKINLPHETERYPLMYKVYIAVERWFMIPKFHLILRVFPGMLFINALLTLLVAIFLQLIIIRKPLSEL